MPTPSRSPLRGPAALACLLGLWGSAAEAEAQATVTVSSSDTSHGSIAARVRSEMAADGFDVRAVDDECPDCPSSEVAASLLGDDSPVLVRCSADGSMIDVCVRDREAGALARCERLVDANRDLLLLRVYELVRAQLMELGGSLAPPEPEPEPPAEAPSPPPPEPVAAPPSPLGVYAEVGAGLTFPTSPGTVTADVRASLGAWFHDLSLVLGGSVRTNLIESSYREADGALHLRATTFGVRAGWIAVSPRSAPVLVLLDLTLGAALLATVGEVSDELSPIVTDRTDEQFRPFATVGVELGVALGEGVVLAARFDLGLAVGIGDSGLVELFFGGRPVTRFGAPVATLDLLLRVVSP